MTDILAQFQDHDGDIVYLHQVTGIALHSKKGFYTTFRIEEEETSLGAGVINSA